MGMNMAVMTSEAIPANLPNDDTALPRELADETEVLVADDHAALVQFGGRDSFGVYVDLEKLPPGTKFLRVEVFI